jgi:hypothetical protein
MRRTLPPSNAGALLSLGVATLLATGLGACSNDSTSPARALPAGRPSFGTGLPANPSTALYKFNMIGVSNPKDVDMTGDNGKRIFVLLNGHSDINLTESTDGTFDILDANGTDKDGARIALPDPDPDNDGVTWYGVWIRTVGTPGGKASLKSCFTGTVAGVTDTFCSLDSIQVERKSGKPVVTNASRQLLTACVDTDGDNVCDHRVFLFDDLTANWLWSVDNNGLKNAQFYFFPLAQGPFTTP